MALPELDLVFCCDTTGSMGSYIKSAQDNITKIVEEITRSEKRDVRFALVVYKDHKDSEVVKVYNFTESLRKMKEYVDQMSASGGGDGPEAVACAMNAVLNLEFRKDATRICILIADAPPHGLEPNGDDYPNGCPCGFDPIEVAKKMAEKCINVYTVGCEPALGVFVYARDFMKAVADITAGSHCALSGANLLSKLIIAGAEEQIQLDKVMDEVVKETATSGGSITTEGVSDDLAEKVAARLKEKGLQTKQVQLDNIVDEKAYAKSEVIAKSSNLRAIKKDLDSYADEKRVINSSAYKGDKSSASYGGGLPTSSSSSSATADAKPEQKVDMKLDYISKDQVKRAAKKAYYK